MDDHTDFGTLEHSRIASATVGGLYGPSAAAAAAAAAVNSGLMQLPSLADTAGRLGVMEGCRGLTPGFGCPPGLHVDYSSSGSISAIANGQLRGWYGPVVQTQGSPYSDMFGPYTGPGGNWRSLTTPPAAPDHFHSPLPGMTHPMWPCPPTPVPCSEGCSLSYYNPPNIYSAYSAYFSLMSSSAASEYPPYLSPRFPGPMPSYQQRLHDRSTAFLLGNSAGGNATPEFPSPWNPYVAGSSAAAPLPSPGFLASAGQLGLGFSNSDAGSTSSKSVGEEQKQRIKQEPVPSKTKLKEDSSRQRDAKRDYSRLWEHSNVSKHEPMQDSKPGLSSKKLMKDEKLQSPTASECSLDLRNNNSRTNTNNNNLNKHTNGNAIDSTVQRSSGLQSADSIRSASAVTADAIHLSDCKPLLKSLHSSDQSEKGCGSGAKQWYMDSCCQEAAAAADGRTQIINSTSVTPDSSHALTLCHQVCEMKRDDDNLTVTIAPGLNLPGAGSSPKTSVSPASRELAPFSGSSSANDLICDSKSQRESERSQDSTNAALASGYKMTSPSVMTECKPALALDNFSLSLNSADSSNKSSSIMQHSLFFEEISNDGMETSEKDGDNLVEESRHPPSESDMSACWITPFSRLPDHVEDNSQEAGYKKVDLDSVVCLKSVMLASSMPSVSVIYVSSSSSSLSTSPAVLSSATLSSVSLSTTVSHTSSQNEFRAISSTSVAPSSVANSTSVSSQQSIALTMYVENSVKLPKASIADGMSCISSQEIDLAMPRQAMRYQVSHQRHNPMQDGCKVHAPTFLPEVCTLPCNVITTITMSSSGGALASLRSTSSSGKNSATVTLSSKQLSGQRNARSLTKSQSCTTEVPIKTEKQLKVSNDSGPASDGKDGCMSLGKGLLSSLLFSSLPSINGSHMPFATSDYLPFLAGQEIVDYQQKSFRASNFQATKAEPTKSTHNGNHDKPLCSTSVGAAAEGSLSSFNASSSVLSSSSSLSSDSPTVSISSQWDFNSVPENLSTKALAAEAEVDVKRMALKPALLSTLGRDGPGLGRLSTNCQAEGSSGTNIPVGIARALQRTIPQPATSEDTANVSLACSASAVTLDRPKTAETKSDNLTSIGFSSSSDCSTDKHGLLCGGPSTAVELEPAGTSSEKQQQQQRWKNDVEMRPPIFPASFNHAWLPAAPPTTLATPVNPTAVWMGQFPFHPGALLPYTSAAVDRTQSQHLFHPTGGYKLAQDPITGQLFFIPVPDVSWQHLGSRMFLESSIQHQSKDKEPPKAMEDSSQSIPNRSRSEEARTDATSVTEASHPSNGVGLPQTSSDLSLQSKVDHHTLPENVDISPLGKYPIVYPATRPPYFFCDSRLFIQESNKEKERTQVRVESRGTSPIQCHSEFEIPERNKSPLNGTGVETEKKGAAPENGKITLNASVQTNHLPPSPQDQKKVSMAEISIQTSDISSDSDSQSSESFAKTKQKFLKSRDFQSAVSSALKSTVSACHRSSDDSNRKSVSEGQCNRLTNSVKDSALSDISSDEADGDSRLFISYHIEPSEAQPQEEAEKGGGIEASSAQQQQQQLIMVSLKTNDCHSKPVSPKPIDNDLLICKEITKYGRKDPVSNDCAEVIQAAGLEHGHKPDAEVPKSNCEPSSSLDLDALVMLSMIASKQSPAAVSEILQQGASMAGSGSSAAIQKFNIFDLPISQFIEAERSPDVNTSYNVPKSCFFNDTEFAINSESYLRRGISEEPKVEDLKSGILKPDEGPENMDPMELDLRMKMAEVQMKYKQEQRELARLQRRSSELRNSSNSKRKKSRQPSSRQNAQKRSSVSKQSSVISDDSSDSSTDAEDSSRRSAKSAKPKNEVKFSASMRAVSNVTDEVNGIKIKVSNPQRRNSSTSMSSTSSQFQKSSNPASFKKEHRHSKDNNESVNKGLSEAKQFVKINISGKNDEIKHAINRVKSLNHDATAEAERKALEMNKCKPDQPKKFNSISGEDMLLKKKPKQFCFYSYKKNKTSASGLSGLGKDMKKRKFRRTDTKSLKDKQSPKADTLKHKIVDDEWYRRRSERIFLHEASVGSIGSPSGATTSSQTAGADDRSATSSPIKSTSKPSRTSSLDVVPKTVTSSQKAELSVTLKACAPDIADISPTKKMPLIADSSETDSDSSSDSDTDDVPLSTLVHKECASDLKTCMLGKDELIDNLRVLYLKDGLYYEGTVKAISPPDVYGVNIDGERSSRQEIVSQEELLDKAILNIRPSSKHQLPEGSRICAYWSQKFSCLYPGTVKNLGEGFTDDDESTVNVEFDDGDSGKIPLAHISMLPPGYQIKNDKASSTMLPIGRKRRNTADDPVAMDQLLRPSIVCRSVSVTESVSHHHTSLDHPTSDGLKQNSSVKPKLLSKSDSLEQKVKREKQEYSCRLKTESSGNKASSAFGLGLTNKKSSQKRDGVHNGEKDVSESLPGDHKKSHLTLMIKRKQSHERETSPSSLDEDDDSTSSDDDNDYDEPRSHKRHIRKKKMKIARIDSVSASDSDEVLAAEVSKKKSQKRSRPLSHKSTKCRKRHRSSSSESGDQIGAFRPVWEQWQWYGPSTRRPGMKGKAKKQFYRAIKRGSEILKIGDAAVFVSMGHNDLQYVGCIDSLWESWDGNMVVKVKWYYHPEETKGGKRLLEIKSALYQSSHEDENDVQTVSHKCEVLSYTNFKKFQAKKHSVGCRPEDVFYLAGTYDPTISMITYEPDVPLNSH